MAAYLASGKLKAAEISALKRRKLWHAMAAGGSGGESISIISACWPAAKSERRPERKTAAAAASSAWRQGVKIRWWAATSAGTAYQRGAGSRRIGGGYQHSAKRLSAAAWRGVMALKAKISGVSAYQKKSGGGEIMAKSGSVANLKYHCGSNQPR
jgi:hypothetical protein